MYLTEVEKLSRFLMNSKLSISEACQFLVLETFKIFKPSALYVGEITEKGCINSIGNFGIGQETIKGWGDIPLSAEVPLTDAVRQDRIVLISKSDYLQKYPQLENYNGIPEIWDSYLVWPTLPYGVMALTLDAHPSIDPETESFIRAVGAISILYFQKVEKSDSRNQFDRFKNLTRGHGQLTERQILIKGLMVKGFSNPAIAREIGYSESLVRQETMAIYAALNISGRRELLSS